MFFTAADVLENFAKANSGFSTATVKNVSQTLTVFKSKYIKVVFDRALNQFFFVKAN